jgi:hypothetical protein
MKKLIVLSMIMALVLLVGSFFAPSHAQDPANEEKPTFYRLVPGVYVNGWPQFTVTYPKDWVEKTPAYGEVFRASAPDFAHGEMFEISVGPSRPLDKSADILASAFKKFAKDVTVVSDKPSRLRDGNPAREVEIKMVINGVPADFFSLATNKGDMWVNTVVTSHRGIREDLKVIPYSLQFEPGKDEPVKVPPDIHEFLKSEYSAMVSHDLAKAMTHFSDRYLHSGVKKGEVERFYRQFIGSITSWEVGITDLVSVGDKACVAGFLVINGTKYALWGTSIIKENGEWKWYGNQRDVSP